ncbi:MAG: 5-formyltetrahydrofolate cyclo-ligase [Bacillota bacterium]|nr:5-formyltetrahydrofolate cyclo-ligase [Bacillota bacterium]
MDKRELRKPILAKRRQLSDTDVHMLSLVICENIRKTAAYEAADNICLYMPINNEVDVVLLMDAAEADGKTTWLPKVKGSEMDFYYYDRETPVVLGEYGITEPDSQIVLEPNEKTLAVMPGAVFSVDRDRIGYGGGYYDKYLEKHPQVMTLATCFDFQIVEHIPAEEHDIRPMAVISEKRIIEE